MSGYKPFYFVWNERYGLVVWWQLSTGKAAPKRFETLEEALRSAKSHTKQSALRGDLETWIVLEARAVVYSKEEEIPIYVDTLGPTQVMS